MEPYGFLVYLLVFPGLGFLVTFALFGEWFDRKLTARMQSRMGPPWFQPWADFVKLLSKEDITPEGVPRRLYASVPLFAFAAVASAFLYVPVVFPTSPFAFQGDLVLVLYLLSLPPILTFLLGWTSGNLFARVGAVRAVSQLFVYEVPFFIAAFGPAIATGSWSISDIASAQRSGLWFLFLQPLGFGVGLIGLQAKLERTPFDIPGAETEIVGGPITELTGRKLAIFRLAMDMALVTGAALLVALFLGGPTVPGVNEGLAAGALGFLVFLAKVLFVVFLLTALKTALGRLRIDQLVRWGWTVLTPLALVQLAVALVMAAGGIP